MPNFLRKKRELFPSSKVLKKCRATLLNPEEQTPGTIVNLETFQRLKYKSMVLSEVSSHDPDHRIASLLKYYKAKNQKPGDNTPIRIPYIRQRIADMSGLRVETVIRR